MVLVMGNKYGVTNVGGTIETEWGTIPRGLVIDKPKPRFKDEDKALAILDMRIAQQKTIEEISVAMNISQRMVLKYIAKAGKMHLKTAKVDKFRGQELAKMEAIREKLMTRILNEEDKIDYRALTHWTALSKSIRELLGADAPKQVQVEGKVSHEHSVKKVSSVEEFMDIADRLIQNRYGSGRVNTEIEARSELVEKND